MPVRFVGGGPGGGSPAFDSDGTTDIGTEGESDSYRGVLAPQSFGAEGEAMSLGTLLLRTPLGTEGESDLLRQTGSALRSLGAEGEDGPGFRGLLPLSFGFEGGAFAANSAITAFGQAGAASRIDLPPAGGDATWATPANAQVEDGAESAISLTGSATAARAFSDELRLDTFTAATTPTGWTRTGYDLVVRHRWTSLRPTLDLTSTCSLLIQLRYTDATEVALVTRTEASPNQATLTTETFALDPAKTVERVMFRANCSIALAQTGTTFAWQVDAARVRSIYSRSGIA